MSRPDKPFSLDLRLDGSTGQILALRDPQTDREVVRYEPGPEVWLNDVPLATRCEWVQTTPDEHLTVMRARVTAGYGAAVDLRIRRTITRGGMGLRAGRRDAVHVQYEVTRVPVAGEEDPLSYIWPPPIEAPLRLDTLTVLGAPMQTFGTATRMRSLALGGTGPREHVSLEDGPVADVVPYLQSGFRSHFPGQLTIGGAMYYHPDDQRWLWIIARRPATSGQLCVTPQRHAYRFAYHTDLAVQATVFVPAVTLAWGSGIEDSERVLAEQFDLYQEPPTWAWHTTWFWLHPAWTRGVDFGVAADAVKMLMDECGVNGFGLFAHDVPLAGRDVDPASPAASPLMGGDEGLRRLTDVIKARGGHSYTWFTRMGHRPDSFEHNPAWAIRGIDGRPVRLRSTPGRGVTADILNPADPDLQANLQRWIAHYVRDLGIDGVFWDSGFQPLPPDFGSKPYLRWPGECNARAAQLYENMLRFGRSLSPDFFMWAEGISVDIPMNCFSVDAKTHGQHSGHRLMHRLAHLGPRRLMWRSAWAHDLASGFTMIDPPNDVGQTAELYRQIADNPMNRWVCKLVKERGTRHAAGLADGVSRLDEYIVVSPTKQQRITLADAPSRVVQHVISGQPVQGEAGAAGVSFDLPAPGGYVFQ